MGADVTSSLDRKGCEMVSQGHDGCLKATMRHVSVSIRGATATLLSLTIPDVRMDVRMMMHVDHLCSSHNILVRSPLSFGTLSDDLPSSEKK